MLAVVRKPPESMQMPLSLFLRMSIITSAVRVPAREGSVSQPGGEAEAEGMDERLLAHSPPPLRTLLSLQQLSSGPEAGLGSLHAHRLPGQGEDLGKVEGTMPIPPALGPRVSPQLRMLG